LLPASTNTDGKLLVATRSLRSFADGVVSVLLASYLSAIGFSPVQIGAIVTGTLLGSAALTLVVGLFGARWHPRQVLFGATRLMLATGLGFAGITAFWPLMVVAIVGTLNPSGGDVSVFLPTEQSVLPETVAPQNRTALFARYNLGAALMGALGALVSGIPVALAHRQGWGLAAAERSGFVLYAAVAIVVAVFYSSLSPALDVRHSRPDHVPARPTRRIVIHLAALFSLDSLGAGFVVRSLLVLWLFRRFHLSVETAGAIFFAGGLLSAFSLLAAGRLGARIGLVKTMVYTHLPSNFFLVVAAFMPTAPLAVFFLLLRMLLGNMDAPVRQSYVMAVVPPHERAAAASITGVPRSLASATTPLLAGVLLNATSFGWPLICAGLVQSVYDVLLLVQFRSVKPPEELPV